MKWTFGDSVQTALADESGSLVMKPCEVVAITVVEGTVLCTVEFADGSDALIPESALLPFTDTAR